MSKGEAPTPPNPIATAGAQTSTNVSTAVANAFLNNTNQTTPLGSLSYDPTSTYSFTDPTTGSTYNIPRFTATQSLTPQEQAIQAQNEAAKYNLASLSAEQSGRLSGLLGSPLDLSGAPQAGDPNLIGGATPFAGFGGVGRPQYYMDMSNVGVPVMGISGSGDQMYGFGDSGPITRTYGPADDFSSDRARVEESLYGRLNPQLKLEQSHIEQQLADQGIRYGSAAYTNAMDSYNRQANDARLAVTQTAGQEQQRMMDMAAKRAGFENAAQMQDYQEGLGRAQLFNQAQAERYRQDTGRAQFYNQAQQQAYEQSLGQSNLYNQAQQGEFAQTQARAQFYNAALAQWQQSRQAQLAAQNSARAQYLQERYAQRGQPLNEITALMSGSQVQQPNFINTPQNQIPTTDVAGLYNTNFNQQFQNYQTQQNATNQLLGGIFGAVGNIGKGAFLSDVRAKENIHRIGSVFVAEPQPVQEPEQTNKELPIYSYSYKQDPASTQHIGPMAQDVEKIDPKAVQTRGDLKHVNASRLMGSILRAA
jgi:Chaperone of endosialidase